MLNVYFLSPCPLPVRTVARRPLSLYSAGCALVFTVAAARTGNATLWDGGMLQVFYTFVVPNVAFAGSAVGELWVDALPSQVSSLHVFSDARRSLIAWSTVKTSERTVSRLVDIFPLFRVLGGSTLGESAVVRVPLKISVCDVSIDYHLFSCGALVNVLNKNCLPFCDTTTLSRPAHKRHYHGGVQFTDFPRWCRDSFHSLLRIYVWSNIKTAGRRRS